MSALQKAIDVFPSQAAFAEALGVVPMTVSQWKARGVPAQRCRDIERVTERKVTRRELRPDLFGYDEAEAGVAADVRPLRRATDVPSSLEDPDANC